VAKINPAKKIQKRRTEAEMRKALQALIDGKAQRSMPPQDDDADIILIDAIEEVLESRQLIEEIKAFVQFWAAKFQRK
jgi:hypothetical protein